MELMTCDGKCLYKLSYLKYLNVFRAIWKNLSIKRKYLSFRSEVFLLLHIFGVLVEDYVLPLVALLDKLVRIWWKIDRLTKTYLNAFQLRAAAAWEWMVSLFTSYKLDITPETWELCPLLFSKIANPSPLHHLCFSHIFLIIHEAES